MSKRMNISIY